jgi:putative FmdB family regulatory protein
MPVYTYRCQDCGFEFTQMQTFSDRPLTGCPECHTNTMERVLQLSTVIFKGSGWYSTDQRSSSGQTRKLDKEKDTADSSPGDESRG